MPKTLLGRWSAWLNSLFLLVIAVSVILVKALGVLDFDDRWWDVTVAVAAPVELIAFITGIVAVTKNKDRSSLVILSIVTGICAVIFALLHSLFISD